MPLFRVKHIQAVWETSSWLIEAADEQDARDSLDTGNAELEWTQLGDAVDMIGSEITDVVEVTT